MPIQHTTHFLSGGMCMFVFQYFHTYNFIKLTTRKIFNPRLFLILGIVTLLSGVAMNYFSGAKGLIQLELGKTKKLVMSDRSGADSISLKDHLGITMTLDALEVRKHQQELDIELWKQSGPESNSEQQSTEPFLVDRFALEPMKISQIEKTDFYFRLKEFYPNFQFAYEYPADRDSISAIAPGITLELKTIEGNPVVTLQSDPASKNILKDIVSLGATLVFYETISRDSIQEILFENGLSENRIIFSGADLKMYYLFDGVVTEKSFAENVFYPIPGKDTTGFKVLYCFPDIAFLKAVPSSKGDEMLNPVAHVEIWKSGHEAIDAFIYPETKTRKGGKFAIPASDYKIGLGRSPGSSSGYCDCQISVMREDMDTSESIIFKSGESKSYRNLRLTPVDCSAEHPSMVTLEVTRRTGTMPVVIGFLFLGISLMMVLMGQKRHQEAK